MPPLQSMGRCCLAVAAVLLAAGCGGARPLVERDAATGEAGQAVDAPSRKGCTPGADQTCNGDPSVSALWGKCLPDGTCSCNAGFVVDDATGLCRSAGSCDQPGASGPWPASLSIDQSNCTARTATDCVALNATPGAVLDEQLTTFLETTCHLPPLTFVMVRFASGCPTVVQVRNTSGGADPTFLACAVKSLGNQRWTCAETANACSLIEVDTLP